MEKFVLLSLVFLAGVIIASCTSPSPAAPTPSPTVPKPSVTIPPTNGTMAPGNTTTSPETSTATPPTPTSGAINVQPALALLLAMLLAYFA